MTDLLLIETGNGGDLVLRGNDLASVMGYENAPYLAMFGGSSNWWGNYLISNAPFASQTENVLKVTPLTSNGRLAIEKAINTDLAFLNNIPGTTWSVTTTIINPNALNIAILINGKQFNFMWNPDSLFLTYQV